MKSKYCVVVLFLNTLLVLGCNKASNLADNARVNKYDVTKVSHILSYEPQTIKLHDLTFSYVEAGQGELIIFLHGFPYFGASWDKLLQPLSKQYHVIAPDNRGYGYTDKPKAVNDYKIATLVEDVRLFINLLANDKKIILIGHDWGGVLAWGVAQQYPELVSKVIVINAPPFNAFINSLANNNSQREASHYIPKMSGWLAKGYFAIKGSGVLWGDGLKKMHNEGHIDDTFKQAFLASWNEEGAVESAMNWYKANLPSFDEIDRSTYWPQQSDNQTIAKIKVPSLLIWSQGDKAFTEDTFNEIPKYVSNMQIKVLNTDSHAPQLDHSEVVLKYIRAFINK